MIEPLFLNREEGGKKLASKLLSFKNREVVILAVPRGGVPVAEKIAQSLKAPLDVLIVRKIPIPWNTEAGFGAVTSNGEILLNEDLLPHLGLSKQEIQRLASEVLQEIKRREETFHDQKKPLGVEDKTVILVDDGLSSGITMLAAIKEVKKKNPREIVVASPVASGSAVEKIKPKVDKLVTLYIHPQGLPFAVASFYQHWTELTDEEVLCILRKDAAKKDQKG